MQEATRRCSTCEEMLPLSAFYVSNLATCAECVKARTRAFRLKHGKRCPACGDMMPLSGRGQSPYDVCRACRREAQQAELRWARERRKELRALSLAVRKLRGVWWTPWPQLPRGKPAQATGKLSVVQWVPPLRLPTRQWVAGTCICGETFVAPRHQASSYHSAECRKRARWKRRDAQRRGRLAPSDAERINAQRVYERDGWRCQICRRTVDRNRKVPWPWAPTLDHIVPLALNGAHAYANLQTAHFACNTHKGTAARDEQLRLVG